MLYTLTLMYSDMVHQRILVLEDPITAGALVACLGCFAGPSLLLLWRSCANTASFSGRTNCRCRGGGGRRLNIWARTHSLEGLVLVLVLPVGDQFSSGLEGLQRN